jgi:hypothetical protein
MKNRVRFLIASIACLSLFEACPASANPTYTLTNLGPTGSTYVYDGISETTIGQINDQGEVTGQTERFGNGVNLGEDAWIFNGNITELIGLTGAAYSAITSSGVEETSTPVQLNDVGEVVGTTQRTGGGDDAFFFNGVTSQQIGLTGNGYSYVTSNGTYEFSEPLQLNSTGDVAGLSVLYSANGTNMGQNVWIFNGTTTYQIGLTGPGYSNEGYSYSNVQQMNASGQIIGTTSVSEGAAAVGGGFIAAELLRNWVSQVRSISQERVSHRLR